MRAQSGQATEYVLTAVLISLGLLLVVFRFGGALRGRFDHATEKLETTSPGSGIRTGGGQEKEGSPPAPQESTEAPAASQGDPGAGGAAAVPRALNFSISWGTAIWILALVAVMAMLYLTRMQKAIRKTQAKEKALREREARLKSENGQAMLEFFFASLVGIVLILGIFQITLIYNARSLVKLAAFNAARAAIVARADSSPTSEDPVDLDLMQKRAKRAAFLTILPVIPAIQGRLDPDEQKRPAVAKNLLIFAKTLQTLAWTAGPIPPSPATDLAVLGSVFQGRAAVALYESIGVTIDDDLNLVDCLDVQFVDPKADLDDDKAIKKAIIKKWPKKIAFDDPKEDSEDNLIKVLVTWRYPLVIPFVNRIITATARPKLYKIALNLEGSSATVADMQKKLPDMNKMIPVWATGFAFSQVGFATFGLSGLAGTIAPIFSGIKVIPTQYETAPGDVATPDEGRGETVFIQKSGDNSIRQSLGEFLIFRVPIRATFVMRMQWDRKG